MTSEAVKKGSGDMPPARPPSRCDTAALLRALALAAPRRHRQALHGCDGYAESEGLDADAEAEEAAAAAAEAADFACAEEWGGDAGSDYGGGGTSADP